MHFGRLTWVLAGLFLLFGVVMLLGEDTAWRRFWAGLCALALGGFAFSMARDALVGGRIQLQTYVLRHAQRPRLFWTAVVLVAAAGVGVSITGLWFLFFGG